MTDKTTEKKLKAKELKTIEQATEKLFSLIDITGTFVLEQNEDVLEIVMDTKASGMVIGYHGEGLLFH